LSKLKNKITYNVKGLDEFTNKVLEEPNLDENYKKYTLEMNSKFKTIL